METSSTGQETCPCGHPYSRIIYSDGRVEFYCPMATCLDARGRQVKAEPNIRRLGWECPRCQAVFGPKTAECVYCNGSRRLFGRMFPNVTLADLGLEPIYEDIEDARLASIRVK